MESTISERRLRYHYRGVGEKNSREWHLRTVELVGCDETSARYKAVACLYASKHKSRISSQDLDVTTPWPSLPPDKVICNKRPGLDSRDPDMDKVCVQLREVPHMGARCPRQGRHSATIIFIMQVVLRGVARPSAPLTCKTQQKNKP